MIIQFGDIFLCIMHTSLDYDHLKAVRHNIKISLSGRV
jgi:hypothetical protein